MEEKKKRTGNGSSPTEVELKDRKTRDRKARRNSWADIYNETTALHKHKKLLGQEVETDDGLELRVKWAQRGAGVSGLAGLICFVARQWIATAVFGTISLKDNLLVLVSTVVSPINEDSPLPKPFLILFIRLRSLHCFLDL